MHIEIRIVDEEGRRLFCWADPDGVRHLVLHLLPPKSAHGETIKVLRGMHVLASGKVLNAHDVLHFAGEMVFSRGHHVPNEYLGMCLLNLVAGRFNVNDVITIASEESQLEPEEYWDQLTERLSPELKYAA